MVGQRWAPNFTLELPRPGCGPRLNPLGRTPASRRHVACRSRVAVRQYTRQATCRSDFGTRASAAQLSDRSVRRTTHRKHREPQTSTPLIANLTKCGRCGATLRVLQHLRQTKDTRTSTSVWHWSGKLQTSIPCLARICSVWRRAVRAARSASRPFHASEIDDRRLTARCSWCRVAPG